MAKGRKPRKQSSLASRPGNSGKLTKPGASDGKLDESVPVVLIKETFATVRTFITGVMGSLALVVAIVCATVAHCFYIAHLPPLQVEKHNLTELLQFFSTILASDWFALGGWVLFVSYLPLSAVVFYVQNQRIVKQGSLNAHLKDKTFPVRFSSRRPDQIQAFWRKKIDGDDEPPSSS